MPIHGSEGACVAWNVFYPLSPGDTGCHLKITPSIWKVCSACDQLHACSLESFQTQNKKNKTTHINITLIKTRHLYFAVGIQIQTQPSMEHSHSLFNPVSVCFLYKRVLEEKQQKPVTIDAVKATNIWLKKGGIWHFFIHRTHSCHLQKERQSSFNTHTTESKKKCSNERKFCSINKILISLLEILQTIYYTCFLASCLLLYISQH